MKRAAFVMNEKPAIIALCFALLATMSLIVPMLTNSSLRVRRARRSRESMTDSFGTIVADKRTAMDLILDARQTQFAGELHSLCAVEVAAIQAICDQSTSDTIAVVGEYDNLVGDLHHLLESVKAWQQKQPSRGEGPVRPGPLENIE